MNESRTVTETTASTKNSATISEQNYLVKVIFDGFTPRKAGYYLEWFSYYIQFKQL